MSSPEKNLDASPRHRSLRRFLQFRLRTLMLLTFVAGVAMFFYTRLEVIEEQVMGNFRVVRQVYRNADGKAICHGWWELFDHQGRRICQGKYKSDQPSGKWTYWHANGRIQQQGEYRNGQRHGVWSEWYEDGQRKLETTHVDGVLDGPARAWLPGATLSYEGQHAAGKRTGQWTFYGASGHKRAEGVYLNDLQEGAWQLWDDESRPTAALYAAGLVVEADGKLLAALRERLFSGSTSQRALAAWALGRLNDLGAAVLDDAYRSGDARIRLLALLELAKNPKWCQANVSRLVEALDENSHAAQDAAMLALSALGPAAKEAVPKLERCLERDDVSRDYVLATYVLATLASIVPERNDLVEAFVERFGSAPHNAEVAYVAPSAEPGLVRALSATRANVRAGAVFALGLLMALDRFPCRTESVSRLAEALLDSDALVRLHACQALGRLGPRAAFAEQHLLKLTQDRDPEVAKAAQEAIESLHPPLNRVQAGGFF
jgi:antitoxin component YwqK of YwqJK toxin-antitoxin module